MQQTPDSIATEILLSQKVTKALFIIVEGNKDVKTYKKFVANMDSEFIIAWGKDNVLAAMTILDNEGIVGVLGIVDADFWHLDGEYATSPNVIVTDDHDIEMMMIRSKSFTHFIEEVASSRKIKKFLEDNDVQDIREILIDRARWIGHLRRYSNFEDLNLQFEGIDFKKFIDKNTLEINFAKVVGSVLALTRNTRLDLGETIDQILSLVTTFSDDLYQICCGHDIIQILGIGLRKCIGNKSMEAASLEVLESELRMSYDGDSFRQTQLYYAAKDWESENVPFQVFA